jgi:hypothetical protein
MEWKFGPFGGTLGVSLVWTVLAKREKVWDHGATTVARTMNQTVKHYVFQLITSVSFMSHLGISVLFSMYGGAKYQRAINIHLNSVLSYDFDM